MQSESWKPQHSGSGVSETWDAHTNNASGRTKNKQLQQHSSYMLLHVQPCQSSDLATMPSASAASFAPHSAASVNPVTGTDAAASDSENSSGRLHVVVHDGSVHPLFAEPESVSESEEERLHLTGASARILPSAIGMTQLSKVAPEENPRLSISETQPNELNSDATPSKISQNCSRLCCTKAGFLSLWNAPSQRRRWACRICLVTFILFLLFLALGLYVLVELLLLSKADFRYRFDALTWNMQPNPSTKSAAASILPTTIEGLGLTVHNPTNLGVKLKELQLQAHIEWLWQAYSDPPLTDAASIAYLQKKCDLEALSVLSSLISVLDSSNSLSFSVTSSTMMIPIFSSAVDSSLALAIDSGRNSPILPSLPIQIYSNQAAQLLQAFSNLTLVTNSNSTSTSDSIVPTRFVELPSCSLLQLDLVLSFTSKAHVSVLGISVSKAYDQKTRLSLVDTIWGSAATTVLSPATSTTNSSTPVPATPLSPLFASLDSGPLVQHSSFRIYDDYLGANIFLTTSLQLLSDTSTILLPTVRQFTPSPLQSELDDSTQEDLFWRRQFSEGIRILIPQVVAADVSPSKTLSLSEVEMSVPIRVIGTVSISAVPLERWLPISAPFDLNASSNAIYAFGWQYSLNATAQAQASVSVEGNNVQSLMELAQQLLEAQVLLGSTFQSVRSLNNSTGAPDFNFSSFRFQAPSCVDLASMSTSTSPSSSAYAYGWTQALWLYHNFNVSDAYVTSDEYFAAANSPSGPATSSLASQFPPSALPATWAQYTPIDYLSSVPSWPTSPCALDPALHLLVDSRNIRWVFRRQSQLNAATATTSSTQSASKSSTSLPRLVQLSIPVTDASPASSEVIPGLLAPFADRRLSVRSIVEISAFLTQNRMEVRGYIPQTFLNMDLLLGGQEGVSSVLAVETPGFPAIVGYFRFDMLFQLYQLRPYWITQVLLPALNGPVRPFTIRMQQMSSADRRNQTTPSSPSSDPLLLQLLSTFVLSFNVDNTLLSTSLTDAISSVLSFSDYSWVPLSSNDLRSWNETVSAQPTSDQACNVSTVLLQAEKSYSFTDWISAPALDIELQVDLFALDPALWSKLQANLTGGMRSSQEVDWESKAATLRGVGLKSTASQRIATWRFSGTTSSSLFNRKLIFAAELLLHTPRCQVNSIASDNSAKTSTAPIARDLLQAWPFDYLLQFPSSNQSLNVTECRIQQCTPLSVDQTTYPTLASYYTSTFLQSNYDVQVDQYAYLWKQPLWAQLHFYPSGTPLTAYRDAPYSSDSAPLSTAAFPSARSAVLSAALNPAVPVAERTTSGTQRLSAPFPSPLDDYELAQVRSVWMLTSNQTQSMLDSNPAPFLSCSDPQLFQTIQLLSVDSSSTNGTDSSVFDLCKDTGLQLPLGTMCSSTHFVDATSLEISSDFISEVMSFQPMRLAVNLSLIQQFASSCGDSQPATTKPNNGSCAIQKQSTSLLMGLVDIHCTTPSPEMLTLNRSIPWDFGAGRRPLVCSSMLRSPRFANFPNISLSETCFNPVQGDFDQEVSAQDASFTSTTCTRIPCPSSSSSTSSALQQCVQCDSSVRLSSLLLSTSGLLSHRLVANALEGGDPTRVLYDDAQWTLEQ